MERITDSSRTSSHVPFCATSRNSPSFDHFAGLGKQRRGYGKPKRFGGLEVNHQFDFRRLLHRQFGWVGPLKDFVHIRGNASEQITLARPVGHQAPHPPQTPLRRTLPGAEKRGRPSRSITTETLAKTVDQLDQHYSCSGCNPGKCPDTRRMVFASRTGSRDIAHDRYLCIAV
jgi:hypothetical protein